ncbi:hypothetical protein [Kitasatospora sp. NPDC048715]|uniref:hypothetical protein n=1 Tax=Kitasatospora sp. NPDC048715 TaxID=3364052 RepID=UPI00371C1362
MAARWYSADCFGSSPRSASPKQSRRRRVDGLGVVEPSLARAGERRIVVELPGVQDPREAAGVIGRTAQLTFHPVVATADGPAGPPRRTGPGSSPTPVSPAATCGWARRR